MTVPHVAVTGAGGFLGWHLRALLRERRLQHIAIPVGAEAVPGQIVDAIEGASTLVHLAGVNRGPDDDVAEGNLLFARQLADAFDRVSVPPAHLVFAGTVHEDGVYGQAKSAAADILATAARRRGIPFRHERLTNLFGEHGRPFYNSVTATFCHLLARGEAPTVDVDRELELMHAQDAVELLLDGPALREHPVERMTVSGLLERLTAIADTYRRGDIPALGSSVERALFTTYRSYLPIEEWPIPLVRHADDRGSFFEYARATWGSGQSSFSSSAPGVVRGGHFHRRKVERFVVVQGEAMIRLRRLGSSDVVELPVDGKRPAAVDMPTMWIHDIVNTGGDVLLLALWSNDIFDPANPDTIPEHV